MRMASAATYRLLRTQRLRKENSSDYVPPASASIAGLKSNMGTYRIVRRPSTNKAMVGMTFEFETLLPIPRYRAQPPWGINPTAGRDVEYRTHTPGAGTLDTPVISKVHACSLETVSVLRFARKLVFGQDSRRMSRTTLARVWSLVC